MGFADSSTTRRLPDPQLGIVQEAGLSYLSDQRLFDQCSIRIGFTGREGGVSEGPFASLNLGIHTDDDPVSVESNRKGLAHAVGAEAMAFIYPTQVHGDRVLVVEDAACVEEVQAASLDGADGVIVTCADVATLLCFADCVPVIIVAPGGFAVVHAGWRGVMARIVPKAVKMLLELIPSVNATDLNIYIGPHIGPCCFETSEELADDFVESFGEGVLASYRHVDLSEALRVSLEEVGVHRTQIIDADLCTVDNADRYFSYRAQDGICGRHGAFCFRKE